MKNSPRLNELVRAWTSVIPHPTLPAYFSLLFDADDNLWVTRYRVRADDAPQWDVFDPAGRFLGTVLGRGHFRATDIGTDYIMGVRGMESGFEQILVYALSKG